MRSHWMTATTVKGQHPNTMHYPVPEPTSDVLLFAAFQPAPIIVTGLHSTATNTQQDCRR
jgi:hypothetical protein